MGKKNQTTFYITKSKCVSELHKRKILREKFSFPFYAGVPNVTQMPCTAREIFISHEQETNVKDTKKKCILNSKRESIQFVVTFLL